MLWADQINLARQLRVPLDVLWELLHHCERSGQARMEQFFIYIVDRANGRLGLVSLISPLATTTSVLIEPVADMSCLRWDQRRFLNVTRCTQINYIAIYSLNVACHLSICVAKLILLYLNATSIGLWHRNGRLEMCLLVNTIHHGLRSQEVVRSLQVRFAINFRCVFHRHNTWRAGFLAWNVLTDFLCRYIEFSCFVVLSDLFLKTLGVWAITCYFFPREKLLSLVLQWLHETFGLWMRIEAHWRSNLVSFVPWSHDPGLFLGKVRAVINIATVLYSFLHSIGVSTRCSKVHSRRSYHLGCVPHLLKALPVVICFFNWLNRHVLNEWSHTASIVRHQTLTLRLWNWNEKLANFEVAKSDLYGGKFWPRLTWDTTTFSTLRRNVFRPFFLKDWVLLWLIFELVDVEHNRYKYKITL